MEVKLTGDNAGITIQANQSPTCVSLYQQNNAWDDNEADIVHICDWPALRDAVDAFQKARNGETT